LLKAVGARHILAGCCGNLKNIYSSGADWTRALSALDRILLLEPRAIDDLLETRDRVRTARMFRSRLEISRAYHAGARAFPMLTARANR